MGNQCAGVRVNRELVSLPTVLHNGDHVEIITSANSRPTASWLNYTVTGKARASIRHYLKSLGQEDTVALGMRLLDKALHVRDCSIEQIPDKRWKRYLKKNN